jgi:hypothetical protein
MNGYPTTNKAYLAFYYPDESALHQGMNITCKLIVIKTNPNRVVKYIQKAFDVLNGQMPGSGKDCAFCRWIDDVSNVRNFSQKLDEWIDDK